MESRVESGRIDLHPIKRARTTFTYLAVAMAGTDTQKAAFRRAVNGAHAQVYSTADSPVQYNAFDLDLQLWVAACLYKGGVDFYRTFVGEIDEQDADERYREGMVLGTTLQVPPEMWPPDRAAFDRYWQEQLDKVHIDDAVREYLYPIAVGRIQALRAPAWLRRLPESLGLLITTGFLPQRFRDEMQFSWDVVRQRRFDRLIAVLRTVNNLMPRSSGGSRSTCCCGIWTAGSKPAAHWSSGASEYPLPGQGLVLRHDVVLNAVVAGSGDVGALLGGRRVGCRAY